MAVISRKWLLEALRSWNIYLSGGYRREGSKRLLEVETMERAVSVATWHCSDHLLNSLNVRPITLSRQALKVGTLPT
jgi:hypothetical protein